MTDKTIFNRPDGSAAKMPGWFSWRHQTNEAHIAANVGRNRRDTKDRKRAEAELRNATANASRRMCGHVHGATGQVCEVSR